MPRLLASPADRGSPSSQLFPGQQEAIQASEANYKLRQKHWAEVFAFSNRNKRLYELKSRPFGHSYSHESWLEDPQNSPVPMYLAPLRKPPPLRFCSSLGIFSAPVARQHEGLPKTSPKTPVPGWDHHNCHRELSYVWATSLSLQLLTFYLFLEGSELPNPPWKLFETFQEDSGRPLSHKQSHLTWKGSKEPRMLRTATTYDRIEAFLLLWLR